MPETSGQNLAEGAEKLNASQFPRIFYARHMQPGIVGYGDETILVDTDALKKLIGSASGTGIPVYLFHNEDTEEERLKKLKEQAVGYVTDSFYNELDGWAYFKFLAVDDAAHKAIGDGWSISNAYVPSRWGEGGTKNNLPYHREVLDGDFTHLAIVPDPRYEDACIMTPEQFKAYQEKKKTELQNAKSDPPKGTPMFKRFFKNTEQEVAADAVDADTMIELQNGKKVSVTEMINAVTEANKPKAMVDVGGKKMALEDLIAKYTELSNSKKEEDDCKMNESEEDKDEEKKNDDEDEEEGKKQSEKKDEKKNRRKARHNEDDSDEDEEEEEERKEKKNSHFDELKNAHLKNDPAVQKIETSMDMVARGKARYGSVSNAA